MGYHWEVLGLEPTGDVLAIKKAYAGLLKKNRPDEHPEAYQELRQAYEWALSEAEWRRRPFEQDTDAGAAGAWPSGSAHGEAGPDAVPEALGPFGEACFESDRADAVLERWADRLLQCEAYQAEACWRELSHEIGNLPLEEQTAASALFADFVLQHETLQPNVLAKMARHFGWGRDYRDAERLGAYRLAQLRERLIQDAPATLRDARQVERATELLRLDWVLEHQGRLFGGLYAALAGPHLGRLIGDSDDGTRRALDISYLRWETIRTAVLQAGLIRLLFALACAGPFALLLKGPGQGLSGWIAAASFFGGGYWLVAWLIARQLPNTEYTQAKTSTLNWVRADGIRLISVVIPFLAIDVVIARDAFPALTDFLGWEMIGACLLVCIAAALAWLTNLEAREIYLPMLGVFSFALTGLFGRDGADWVVAVGVAAAWMALGGWVYHQYHDQVIRFYRKPWAVLRTGPWWGWVLFVLVAFRFVVILLAVSLMLALPVTLRVLARYMSANTALLAIWLAVALAVLAEPGKAAAYAALPVLVLTAAVLLGLQALAERLSGRLFRRVPATFFQHDD